MHISYYNRVRTPHKANGISVFLSIFALYIILIYYRYWSYNWAYLFYQDTFLVVNTISLVIGILIFMQGKLEYKIIRSANTTINNIKSFWEGISKSPRLIYYSLGQLEVDRISLTFCLILSISIASQQYHKEVYEELKPATALYFSVPLFTYLSLLSLWIIEKLTNEIQQTYSSSFLTKTIGWKVIWWRCCIIPFYYSLPIHNLLISSHYSISPLFLIFFVSLFFLGLILSRGSVQQRYLLKTAGPRAIIWGDRPIVVEFTKKSEISDIVSKQKRLLVSGWWGVIRHPRHVGEGIILFSLFFLTLFVQFSWIILFALVGGLAYLYWNVTTMEKHCSQKYGDVWRHYCICVPYKLFPYIF